MNHDTPATSGTSKNRHLCIPLGQVAMKQSATNQVLETHETLQKAAIPATARE